MSESGDAADADVEDRFTPVAGHSPRATAVAEGDTRVSVRGFVEIRREAVSKGAEYLEETIKPRCAEGELLVDGVFTEGADIDEEITHTLADAEAEEGYVAIEGWEVVGGDAGEPPEVDTVRVNVAGFVDLPTEAITNEPPYVQDAASLASTSLLSDREAQLATLRDRGLNHRQIAAVMGITKGSVDKQSQRITEKKGRALHQMHQAKVTARRLEDVPNWVPTSLTTTEDLRAAPSEDLTVETNSTKADSLFVLFRGWEWSFAPADVGGDSEPSVGAEPAEVEWALNADGIDFGDDRARLTGVTAEGEHVHREFDLRDVHPADPDVREAWRNTA